MWASWGLWPWNSHPSIYATSWKRLNNIIVIKIINSPLAGRVLVTRQDMTRAYSQWHWSSSYRFPLRSFHLSWINNSEARARQVLWSYWAVASTARLSTCRQFSATLKKGRHAINRKFDRQREKETSYNVNFAMAKRWVTYMLCAFGTPHTADWLFANQPAAIMRCSSICG